MVVKLHIVYGANRNPLGDRGFPPVFGNFTRFGL